MGPEIPTPTPITGITTPGGKPGLRRPLAVFQKEQKLAFSLYVQALLAWQQAGNDKDDRDNGTGTSYFQVTGIHGVPPVKWQNDPAEPFEQDVPVGYCTHRSTLFIPWHRPYLMLYEQIIYAYAKDIVDHSTGSAKEAYAAALPEVRLPYWDWASNSSLPDAIKTPDITISVPGDQPGTLKDLHLDHNPLWSYKFQSEYAKSIVQKQMEWDNKEPWTESKRCPDPDGTSNIGICDLQMITIGRQFTETTWNLLLRSTDFDELTCQAWRGSNGATAYSSIEVMHNNIHNFSGSQATLFKPDYEGPLKLGSMTEVQASSFDPIFWLHHVNCDRLVALWQARQTEVTIHPYPSLLPRFNAGAQTVEDGNSRLEPWHKDNSASINSYWIANDAKDLISTFNGGYYYPETPLEFINDPTLMYVAVTNAIEKLYRPGYLPPAPPISAKPPSAEPPSEGQPPKAPMDGQPPVGAPPEPPRGANPAETTKVWEAFVRVKNFALTGTWVIYIFLGQIPEDSNEWFMSKNQVGVISLLSTLDRTSCENCLSQSERDQLVTGTAPLSGVLHDRGIDVSDEDAVVKYLKKNLGWRIVKDIKNVPIKDDFNLTVGVSSQDLTLPAAGSGPPSFGDSKTYPSITAGKRGGLDEHSRSALFGEPA
ncbi:hypothetical protein PFICI_14984 [Pestalotiopsis fici W106-1]|uniref:tyrosinase n=1 Tax=Pestalotiopsis fici (strain W106-1 / CGMCC3.15140) TaxID=1229662 RepID=W3WHW9_PESFW|nr:uncharacterized protein PFICI_14984 [Pestalotiopsis fici W106-1]ETS73379.1 hypothetical protein PFICI_14984 [Pestalotiopsis fici W106-1]